MKKGLSGIFILAFTLFLNAPLLAQRSKRTKLTLPAQVSVKYSETQAFSDGNGVWIEWQTEVESNNLGFYVYRISAGQTERINKGLVAGDYMRGELNSSGGKYSFYDAQGDSGSAYYIESLDTNGRIVSSGIVSPQAVEDLAVVAGVSSASLKKSANAANPVSLQSEKELPDDLQTEVNENAMQSDAGMQRWVAAQPGVRIGVNKEGFYRVSRAELQSAGFDVNAPSAFWQLYVNGVQQSIIVGGGGAYVEFYGRGIDTPEADTQIYYLLVGAQNGKRIGTTASRSFGGRSSSASFTQSLTKKERFSYATLVLNGDAENFFGSVVNSTGATINFNLPAVDFNSGNASVDIAVQGLTLASHQTAVVLNGTDIGAVVGNLRDSATRHYNIPTSFLRAGANTLQLTAVGGSSDISLFDSIKVNYARRYQAEQNRLSFYTTNYRASNLEGFSSPNVRVFDVTYGDSPTIIANLPVTQSSGGYRVYLPASRGRVMYAVEDSAISQVASINANTPSSLSTSAHNAELVIVSYKDWMAQANDWADYRRASGMSVEVVNIEDVFDEFNFGVVNSLSIRSFLQYAKSNWQTPPRYILLIGDSTYDPKNYTGAGNFNFVPTKLVDTIYGEAPSDDTLADFNDDGLAEIAVGRSPARSSADVTQLFNKTKTFEQTSAHGFDRGFIFASDAPVGWDFAATSNRLRDLLPAGTSSVMVNTADTNAKARLISEMNNGRFFINYAGHGASSLWGYYSPKLFDKTDAAALTNGNNLSVFTLLTCLNGYFVAPNVANESLAEVLLKAQNGGAVAVWASTGETTPDIQEIMATRFYQQLSLGNMKRLGDLTNDAKATINAGRDVRLSWVLLGDPTLKVR